MSTQVHIADVSSWTDGMIQATGFSEPHEDELLEEQRDVETLARETSVEIERNGVTPDWPRTRLRINFTKNTKGFNYDITAEVDGEFSPLALADTWDQVHVHGIRLLRKGLARHEQLERGETDEIASKVAAQVVTSPGPAESIDEMPF